MIISNKTRYFPTAGVTGGYYLSHSDVAGPHSGTLFGITNTMAQIPGFANALIVANLTPNVCIFKGRFISFQLEPDKILQNFFLSATQNCPFINKRAILGCREEEILE